MPKLLPATLEAKQTAFIKEVVRNGGQLKRAYKAIRPHVNDNSAKSLGSKELSRINQQDIQAIYEKVGCTKEVVISGLWARMQKMAKDSDYVKGVVVLGKFAGWDKTKTGLQLDDKDVDLIEIIKVRLKKAAKKDDVIDVKGENITNADVVSDSNQTT